MNNCFFYSIILLKHKWLTTLKPLLSRPSLLMLSQKENYFHPQSLPTSPLLSLKVPSSKPLPLRVNLMRNPSPLCTTKSSSITFSPYSTFTPLYFHYNYLIPFFKGHMAIHAATILTRFLIYDSSFLLLYMTHIDYDSYSTYINQ